MNAKQSDTFRVYLKKEKKLNNPLKFNQQMTEYLSQQNESEKNLQVVKSFMDEQKDGWNEISEEQQHAIDHSLAEMKAGKLTPHDDVMKQYRK